MSAPPARRGRPRLAEGEQTTPVCVRLNDSAFDRACRLARREDTSVSELLRRGLQLLLLDDDDDDR